MKRKILAVLGLSLFLNVGTSLPIKAKAEETKPQEVLVVYKNSQGKDEVLSKSQKVEKKFQHLPAVSVTMTEQEINKLENNPNIAYVEPNIQLKIADSQLTPVKIGAFSTNSASSTTAEESEWDLQAVKAPLAWEEGMTGKGVKVAVLDTGISSHPDLKIAGGVSMVSYTNSYSDDNGHGTHVAGIVGALHNDSGMVGMAPDAQLYAVKVMDKEGLGDLTDVLSGIDWAISNHMNLINLSLGTTEDSQLLHDMIDKATNNGVLVVCASGNSGNAQGTGDNIEFPAKYPNVLSVSAVDSNLVRASFSSTGAKIDFAAPGEDIVSTYFESGYAIGSGTSQAAPHVTGLMALLKQKYPTKSNDELITILKSYAQDLGSTGKDPWYGDGFAQYPISSDPTPEIPLPSKGYIDSPAYGATIHGFVNVSGWFLDDSGVSKLEVVVDGKSIGTAQYGSERLDVENAYPQYQNANSGFQYSLDSSLLSNGEHSLTIRETGKNGTVTVLSSKKVNVYNLTPIGRIDNPVNGSVLNGTVNVRGWFLDPNGVSKVDILVDGQYVGTADYGRSRLDVQKAYPQYQNANSGYLFPLNTQNFSDGEHILSVRETGMNGAITTLPDIEVKIINFPPKGYIDRPGSGSTIQGLVNVSGWFLDGSGVSKIEVLVDGKSMGTALYGSERLDVEGAYPQYQNANSGFQYSLDSHLLTNGEHLLTIRETGKNGTITTLPSRKVNVDNLPSIGRIDSPVNGSVVNGVLNVRGWFLDQNGVSKVDVLVDGQYAGTAEYGMSRLDVQKAYPKYQNANSGYLFALDTLNWSDGQHTLTVKETGMDGTTKILNTITIQVKNFPPKGYMDTPASGSTIYGLVNVSGWFLDGSGVSKIEVLVDGKSMGTALYGNERTDVEDAYPQYQNANSGFEYSFDTTLLSNGEHFLTVQETGKNGTSTVLSNRKVNVANLPTIGRIDNPIKDSVLNGAVNVRGWLLDQEGVSKVEVLVDGQSIGTAEYGRSRLDVQHAYPEYQNANSGYQYTLDTSKITNGGHTLTVKEIGENGKAFLLNTHIMINN